MYSGTRSGLRNNAPDDALLDVAILERTKLSTTVRYRMKLARIGYPALHLSPRSYTPRQDTGGYLALLNELADKSRPP